MNQNNPKFKKLQKEWYEKLKKEGFDNIERKDGSVRGLGSSRNSPGNPGHNKGYHWHEREVYNKSKEEYFRLAGHFLYEHKFSSKLERYIWELHANGLGVRSIVSTLHELKNPINSGQKDKIHKIIVELTKKMKEMYFE